MAFPVDNGSFFGFTHQQDADYYDNDNNGGVSYESDYKEKSGRKSARKSTKGRKLKRWDADEDQKLLLYIEYVCIDRGVVLPWDDIAAEMEPRNPTMGENPMTGEAVKQHLQKLRYHRIQEGYDVPPKLDRNARRMAATGKNAPQTPLPTPKKSSGTGGQFGKGKGESEVPVKKESTLLAPISKIKQKRAEKAKKSFELVLGLSGTPAANGRASSAAGNGAKGVTGKRGRRPAIVDEDEYRDNTRTSGAVSTKKLRHPKPKHDSGLTLEAEDNIKNEPESDDDLPLSKRRKVPRKSGVSKQPTLGLMDNTLEMWKNRDANTATGQTTVQSAGIEGPKQQSITSPNDNDQGRQNEPGFQQIPKTTPCAISDRVGIPFAANFPFEPHYPKKEYQGPVPHSQAGQQGNVGDNFGNTWFQLQSGHPSPMDNSSMRFQTSIYPGAGQVVHMPYASDPVGPPTPWTPLTHGDMAGQAVYSSDRVGPVTPYTAETYGNTKDQAVEPSDLDSKFGSFSSHTLPGTAFNPDLGGNDFYPMSRTVSWNSSVGSAHEIQDPFVGSNDYGAIAGLPVAMPNMNASDLAAASHTAMTLAGLDTNYHNLNLNDTCGQNLPDLAEPSMPAAGLGIAIPHNGGGVFDSAAMASPDDALLQGELASSFLTQPPTPIMASGLDHAYPQDLFDDVLEVSSQANLSHILNNDTFG